MRRRAAPARLGPAAAAAAVRLRAPPPAPSPSRPAWVPCSCASARLADSRCAGSSTRSRMKARAASARDQVGLGKAHVRGVVPYVLGSKGLVPVAGGERGECSARGGGRPAGGRRRPPIPEEEHRDHADCSSSRRSRRPELLGRRGGERDSVSAGRLGTRAYRPLRRRAASALAPHEPSDPHARPRRRAVGARAAASPPHKRASPWRRRRRWRGQILRLEVARTKWRWRWSRGREDLHLPRRRRLVEVGQLDDALDLALADCVRRRARSRPLIGGPRGLARGVRPRPDRSASSRPTPSCREERATRARATTTPPPSPAAVAAACKAA